ncbi:MAG TPA: hypothetical protein VI072_06115 [Polyangiaceae bacterium]
MRSRQPATALGHAEVPSSSAEISGVLPRATETCAWAVAGVGRRPYAALGGVSEKGRTQGTSAAPSHDAWLRQAGGRLATPLCDGTLLCDEQRTLWVIFGGARFAVPSAAAAERLLGDREPVRVQSSALARVGTVPRDGTLLREAPDAGVFVMLGGRKHKVTACIDPAHVLWTGALAAIP